MIDRYECDSADNTMVLRGVVLQKYIKTSQIALFMIFCLFVYLSVATKMS